MPESAQFANGGLFVRYGGNPCFSGYVRNATDPSIVTCTLSAGFTTAIAAYGGQYDFKVGDMLVDYDTGTIMVITALSASPPVGGTTVTMVQQNNFTNWNGVWKDTSTDYPTMATYRHNKRAIQAY